MRLRTDPRRTAAVARQVELQQKSSEELGNLLVDVALAVAIKDDLHPGLVAIALKTTLIDHPALRGWDEVRDGMLEAIREAGENDG